MTACIIVAYDNNQIVRNVKCVGLAASRGQRGVCETNNKQPHAVWVLPWLNDIFPLGLSCFTSAADQTSLLPFFFFLPNDKTEAMTLIQASASTAKTEKPFVTSQILSNLAKPLNRRLLPGDGEIRVGMTEGSFYGVWKQPHSESDLTPPSASTSACLSVTAIN